MNYHLGRHTNNRAPLGTLFVTALVLIFALAAVTGAPAQKITTPTAPAAIAPPTGTSAFLTGHAVGTQGYVCLPTSTGASWTVNGSRPEATLFGQNVQVITHFVSPDANPNEFAPNPLPFGSPTWQSSLDGSIVWAKALTPPVAAGSHASCPERGLDSVPLTAVHRVAEGTNWR